MLTDTQYRLRSAEDPAAAGMEILREAGILSMNKFQPRPVDWLWYPYVPLGKVTVLQGDPSGGKTTLMLNLIAALTRGESLTDPAQKRELPSQCLYQTAEDGIADTIVPRLMTANAVLERVICLKEREEAVTLTDGRLEKVILALRPDLVVLDPIQAFLGDCVDMHRANEIRPRMAYLAELAEAGHTAVVLIGHLNKRAGDEAIYRGLGSIDIAAAARSVLLMEKNKNDPALRTLRHIKSSLAPEGDALDFRLEEDGVLHYSGIHAADSPPARGNRALALSYKLRTLLGSQTRPVEEVRTELTGTEGSCSNMVWAEAKRLANAETFREDGVWKLRIAPDADFSELDKTI